MFGKMFEKRQNIVWTCLGCRPEPGNFHTLGLHLANHSSSERQLIVLTVKGLPQHRVRCAARAVNLSTQGLNSHV